MAAAVLVRAIQPDIEIETMRRRRGRPDSELTNGPGKLAAALGLDLQDNGTLLGEGRLAILDGPAPAEPIALSGRIGLSSGHDLDLRFYLLGNPWVSRGRTGPLVKTARRPVRI